MLPNRMELSLNASQQLRKLKANSGLAPNLVSRIGFFRSIESQYKYCSETIKKKELSKDEKRQIIVLDKVTWLGHTQLVTELLLKKRYPNYDSKELHAAWVWHVEHGIGALRSHKNVAELIDSLGK